MKGLVLDLRNDPGGLLHGAVGDLGGVPAAEDADRLHRRPRRGSRKKFFASPEDYARGSRSEDVLKAPAAPR